MEQWGEFAIFVVLKLTTPIDMTNDTTPVKDTYVSPYRSTGSLYAMTRDLSNTEVAKLIRKELTTSFPNYKFTVTAPRNSINVGILDLDYNPFSTERQADLLNNTDTAGWNTPRYNEQYLSDRKKFEEIHSKYNYDDSNVQSDYFNTRYYGSVDITDSIFITRYYPNNIENNRVNSMMEKWNKITKTRNEDATKRRSDIKKGDKVTLSIARNWGYIPAGEYEAMVYRAPNGRGVYDTFTVGIELTQVLRKGILTQLDRPLLLNDLKVTKSEIKQLVK